MPKPLAIPEVAVASSHIVRTPARTNRRHYSRRMELACGHVVIDTRGPKRRETVPCMVCWVRSVREERRRGRDQPAAGKHACSHQSKEKACFPAAQEQGRDR